jgi:riboflavin kinase
MEVVAVPSIPKQTHLYIAADEVISSLLDLQPELWGLPPFEDCKSQKTCVNVEVAFIFFSF